MSNTFTQARGPMGTMGRPGVPLALPRWLRGRRAVVVAALAAVGAGLALGLPSLVALGVAPILVALLPCAAMCALGVCMMRAGGRSCRETSASDAASGGNPAPSAVIAWNPRGDA
jgi:hypothetical protein